MIEDLTPGKKKPVDKDPADTGRHTSEIFPSKKEWSELVLHNGLQVHQIAAAKLCLVLLHFSMQAALTCLTA